MRNLRLVIAYHGAAYSGWQIQPNVPTVQGAIEKQVMALTCAHTRVRGAGRTDAGVHAAGQVANFYTESTITTKAFFRGLNSLLPPDISIRSVVEVPLDFDARRFNRGKHYRYSIWNSPAPSPNLASTSLHIHKPLDLVLMARAARHLFGTHDFSTFRAADCTRDNRVRTLFRCGISRHGPLVHIHVEGSAFLKNMVRIIAGTLIEVGRGRRDPDSLAEVLAAMDRRRAGFTARPHGLCMMRVFLARADYTTVTEEVEPPSGG